ncbi:MAG: Yip1 family protein [Methanomicrobium sp.]|nr:Yip1 family protein [Methanomicrobium sp.]
MKSIKDLLISPGDFFERLCSEPESLKAPVLIIFIAGIVSAVSALIALSATSALIPAEMASLGIIISAFTFVFTIVFTFVVWVVLAGLFHIISSYLNGTGSFTRSLEVTAYGMIPQIIGAVISAVLIYMHLSSVSIGQVTSLAEAEALTAALSTGPLMTAGVIVSIIFILWSANIWIFGFMKCRQMEAKKAAIAVGIPTVLLILFTALALL